MYQNVPPMIPTITAIPPPRIKPSSAEERPAEVGPVAVPATASSVTSASSISSPHATAEEKTAARAQLSRLPRDASPTRIRNRGASDGRPRGYLRKFGLSRVKFREAALRGELPGVTKSSW